MTPDRVFMERALELARRGAGLVSPNPMVGAVLVRGIQIVGEGFHRYDLLKHAESYAIEMAGPLASGATLYCSLEPCCHHGRTPPCTDALIRAGIRRAVVALADPNPRVSGRGIDQLRAAAIEVEVGLLEREASRLNEYYLKYIQRGIPFVHKVLVDAADSLQLEPTKNLGNERAVLWQPSGPLREMVSEYDAVVLGALPAANRSIVESCLARARHRPLVIAGAREHITEFIRDQLSQPGSISRGEDCGEPSAICKPVTGSDAVFVELDAADAVSQGTSSGRAAEPSADSDQIGRSPRQDSIRFSGRWHGCALRPRSCCRLERTIGRIRSVRTRSTDLP